MSTEKTFTVGGTSIKKGELKLRVANGSAKARQKILEADKHENIMLFDLPRAMTKDEISAWLVAEHNMTLPEPKAAPEPKEPGKRGRPRKNADSTPAVVTNVAPVVIEPAAPLAHEDLGRELHAMSSVSFMSWDTLTQNTREEFCYNAAKAAGYDIPAGTYPALEAMHESAETAAKEIVS